MATTELRRPPDDTRAAREQQPPGALLLPPELTGDGPRAFVVQWLVTRAAMFALLVSVEGSMTGDVSYYARSLRGLFRRAGVHGTLQEYPLPVLAIMVPQYLLGLMNTIAFTVLFALSMLAVDAAFTQLLWRAGGGRRTPAVMFWLWFLPAIGPIAYFRVDIIPAVLAGAALLATQRRPAVSGMLTAVGAALKLWPAIMLPIFLLRRGDRSRVAWAFVTTGAALALLSLVLGGWRRSVSPLSWQAGRGLQIESVPAGPLMLARMVHPHGIWHTPLSIYKAFEITGAGVRIVLILSTLATAAGIIVLAVLWNRCRRMPELTTPLLGWLLLATAAVITVTNKVLSPQYVIWLAGPLAIMVVLRPGEPAVRRAIRLLLLIAVLTQLTYPLLYPQLLNVRWMTPIATLVLEARNAVLLVFTWQVCRETWRVAMPATRVRP
ncbi:MAG: glycosyltransferase family 87 protein [Actinomycetota bacterium]